MQISKKFLVICVATDRSEHRGWLKLAIPDFDLMIVYCGVGEREEEFRKDAKYFLKTSGLFKLENVACALKRFRSEIMHYQAVWLPDDDISTDAAAINQLFSLFRYYDLQLAQPSLYWSKGAVNHKITAQRRECILRYTNYVEIMAPLFKTHILLSDAIIGSMTIIRSGWGVAFIWAKILGWRSMAIIDAVGVYHKKNAYTLLGGQYYRALEKLGIDPWREYHALLKEYAVTTTKKEFSRIKKPGISYWPLYLFSVVRLHHIGKCFRFYNYLANKVTRAVN